MADTDTTAPVSATDAPVPEKGPRSAADWLEEIKQAEKDSSEWYQRAEKIERLYLEERTEVKKLESQYALLWANVSVLQPAVYARQPQPVVTRRFTDKDPVARNVSEVMERSLVTLFDHADIDACLRSVRDDFLVVGQGTAWVRYVPTLEQEEVEIGDQVETQEVLKDETLSFDYVNWKDFLHPKCRRWEELPWVGRRVFPDDNAGRIRFGAKVWDAIKARHLAKNPGEYAKKMPKDKPCIYEIWSRRDKEVIWVAKDYDQDVLDRRPPLYDLRGFFPCPRPAFSTLPTDSLYSIPDYVYYQDQAEEINTLTGKIGTLQDALKLVGFYPAGGENGISDAIEKALSAGTSNQMIPVPAWAAWTSGGGSKGMIEWLPIDTVLNTLKGCVELRQALINDVFQITGLSDILRGQGEKDETATAQSLKAQWGGVRIRERQSEIARFARDLTRIAAEIVAEKFQPETLWQLSGLKFPSAQEKQMAQLMVQQMQQAMQQQAMQAQMAQQQGQPAQPPQQPQLPPQITEILEKPSQEELVALMQDDRLRSYRIDIETDSTIVADEQAEKESRTEFVTMLSGLLQQGLPAMQQVPEIAPVIGESLLFVTRAFRAGRQLEDTIEQFVENIVQKAKQSGSQPPPPDPRMEKIKADAELGKAKLQVQAQEGQAKLQLSAQESAAKRQQEAQEFAAEFALDKVELAAKLQREREKTEAEQARTAQQAAAQMMRPV